MNGAPGEPAAGAPAAHRRHAREGGVLEVVGCGVRPGARELEQIVHAGRLGGHDGRGRPSPAHGDDDHGARLRQEPRDVARHGRLADALPAPDHGQRGKRKRRERHGLEAEVGADVRQARREHLARERHAVARAEDGLVGEVDHRLGAGALESLGERCEHRHAVVLPAPKLLRAAQHDRADDLVGQLGERGRDDVRVVLAVDQGQRLHCRDLISASMRPVYFSNSSVSIENWMIRSCPWNGYLRHTSTWRSDTSIRL